jgi:hypothetical protein
MIKNISKQFPYSIFYFSLSLFCRVFYTFFHGYFWAFLTLPRPLHGPSRPWIFHGPRFFSTATFEQRGRGDGHLATLSLNGRGEVEGTAFRNIWWSILRQGVRRFYRLRKYQIIPYKDLFNNFFDHNKYFINKTFLYQGWKQPLLALLLSNN